MPCGLKIFFAAILRACLTTLLGTGPLASVESSSERPYSPAQNWPPSLSGILIRACPTAVLRTGRLVSRGIVIRACPTA
eukprot:127113-Chlamydomonas_euryale.AAC.1